MGILFEAILAAKSGVISQRESQESSDAKVSFATRIEGLQTENAELNNQLNQWRNQAVKELELKKLAEVHASHLKTDNQQLQQEVQRLALMADYLRGIAIRYSQEANRVLDKLKSKLHSFSKEDIT